MELRGMLLAAVVVAAWACTDKPKPATAGVVDSAISREEALRRFRLDLPEVTGFSGGNRSRDSLVRGFLSALERRDAETLRNLVLSRAEFAYLYYPSSPQSLPPYDLSPDLMWFMQGLQGDEGLRHTLDSFGGRQFTLVGYDCPATPERQNGNSVWAPCLVRWKDSAGIEAEGRLFGPIVERDGVFKFVSYSSGRD